MKSGTHDRGTTLFPLYQYEQVLDGAMSSQFRFDLRKVIFGHLGANYHFHNCFLKAKGGTVAVRSFAGIHVVEMIRFFAPTHLSFRILYLNPPEHFRRAFGLY